MEEIQQRVYQLDRFIRTYILEQNLLSIQLVERILQLERQLRELQYEPGQPYNFSNIENILRPS